MTITAYSPQIAVVTSSALSLFSAWLCFNSAKSRIYAITFFTLISFTLLVNLIWAAIDSITGEGINAAAIYHIRYGTRGAGYSDYHSLILITITIAITVQVAVALLVFGWGAAGRRSPARLWTAFLVSSLGICFSPAVADLFKASRLGFATGSDFATVYVPPYILPRKAGPPKNLVYIYAESLERTYFDESIFPGLMRELTKLENEATSFTGITQIDGTGWTMAGIVASQCGIPLLVPAGDWAGNSMSGMDAFLPGAKGLSDLLKDQGYYLCFMGGADAKFAGKDKFLKTHQFDEILGREELLPHIDSKSYLNDWGLYDDTLFSLALKKAEDLSDARRPFALAILTLETHFPFGFQSRTVAGTKYGDGSDPLLNSVAGSAELIANFIRRLRQSKVGANTVIVLASDHFSFKSKATALMDPAKRRNLFMVFSPNQNSGEVIATEGSTLDIASTLLPFLGFRGTVGLGRDLRDMSIIPAERRRIMEGCRQGVWSQDILALWDFPRFSGQIEVDPENKSIVIGQRLFKAPALISLNPDGTAMLTFEFDSPAEYLSKAVEDRSRRAPFVFFTTKGQAPALLEASAGNSDDWFLIAGSSGEVHRIIRINKKRHFNTADLLASMMARRDE